MLSEMRVGHITKTSKLSDVPDNKLEKAFSLKTSIFNKFTHEKERSIAYLKLILAQMLAEDHLIITGFSAFLIPREVSHVLQVCLIADMKFRVSEAVEKQGLSQKEAVRLIHKRDEERAVWVNTLFENEDPWDTFLYDIVIPVNKMTVEEAAGLITDNLAKPVVKATEEPKKALEDFLLSANVEVALTREDHNVSVTSGDGV